MRWFTENPLVIYVLCVVLAAVCLIAFFVSRRVLYLGVVAGLLVLGLVATLIDYLVETDREQVERRTHELAKAAESGDFDLFATFISKDFYANGINRDGYLLMARGYLLPAQPRHFDVWNVQVTDDPNSGGREIMSLFSAQARGTFHGYEDHPIRLELAFKKDPDGVWRVRSFRLLQAINDQEVALPKR